ncbi:alpha/beta fold hydrolase [Nesterenkonia alba]|uniref:alpha/beta fold hydrolase n=1 Tax=Nesterenkonia alba TaxID=515814 RepID=UPI0003B3B30E|nr:alpha/beta fold hydrolase [Nesterenkonia alba]
MLDCSLTGRTNPRGGILQREGSRYSITLNIPRQWRGSYTFYASPERIEHPQQGADHRQWWLAVMSRALRPANQSGPWWPLNSRRSVFETATPDAPPQRWVPGVPPHHQSANLEIQKRRLAGKERTLWCRRISPDPHAPVVVVFDGAEFTQMGLFEHLHHLPEPPAAVLAIDAMDTETRTKDLRFGALFRDEVLRLCEEFSSGPVIPMGASYGGLAATYWALSRPDRVREAVALSASFWAEDDSNRRAWELAAESAGPGQRIVLDVGTLEPMLTEAHHEAAPHLQARGIHVVRRSFVGGHDWIVWRDRLIEGLELLQLARAS